MVAVVQLEPMLDAVFVEHPRQLDELVRLGCVKGQGRLLGAPAAALAAGGPALPTGPRPGGGTA